MLLRERIRLYLYGTPHLIGSTALLGGLGLYFGGIIDNGWWAILIGLYLAGVLVAQGFVRNETIVAALDEERLQAEIKKLVLAARPRIPPVAQILLDSIEERANSLIPILDDLAERGIIGAQVRHDVLSGLTRYLPDTLGRFLALPPAYLKLHPDGKNSPLVMLEEQLKLIDTHLANSLIKAFDEHASELAIQGRFLAQKIEHGTLP